jgi:hypothetical protein
MRIEGLLALNWPARGAAIKIRFTKPRSERDGLKREGRAQRPPRANFRGLRAA